MTTQSEIEIVCGNCVAWRPVAAQGVVDIGIPRRGICMGVPPTPYPKFDRLGNLAGQLDLRPCPTADNGCLLFQPRPDLIPPPPPAH